MRKDAQSNFVEFVVSVLYPLEVWIRTIRRVNDRQFNPWVVPPFHKKPLSQHQPFYEEGGFDPSRYILEKEIKFGKPLCPLFLPTSA